MLKRNLSLAILGLFVLVAGSASACCDTPPCPCEGPQCCTTPSPSPVPPEPTGFALTLLSPTTAELRWDAVPCNDGWVTKLYEAYVYISTDPRNFYRFYTGPWVELATLPTNVTTFLETDVDLPGPEYFCCTPKKSYRLCVANTQTGQETCAPRALGITREDTPPEWRP